jgi:deoxyribose-phosphate aldolase
MREMDKSPVELLAMIDHAVLKPDCTRQEILEACQIARQHRLGCICVPPSRAALAVAQLADAPTPVGSVVGFPFGFALPGTKAAEANALLAAGCVELDMVINISALRSGDDDIVTADIAAVAQAMGAGRAGPVLKVIMETCYLNDDEIACGVRAAVAGGAQFVKTSTGFGPHGATVEHVALLRELAPPEMGVKAAGGIRTLAEMEAMIDAGADRIGTSATLAIVAELGI